jgi:FixJ family two-component response regulator
MLKGIQRLLRQHEYEPILFSSAEAFKKHADIEKAVCVILDINLNDGSGIELRYHLKADGHSVPVIYMTASDNSAVREAALASGCIAFLTKPFSVQELIEPLKRAGGRAPAGTRSDAPVRLRRALQVYCLSEFQQISFAGSRLSRNLTA